MIKLINLKYEGFDRSTGADLGVNEIKEYKCSRCEHIVGENDKFCWQCGKELTNTATTERWVFGLKIETVKEFNRLKRMNKTDCLAEVKAKLEEIYKVDKE